MKFKKIHFLSALWRYLNQPLFTSKFGIILNPIKCFYPYQIRLLENCWAKDYALEKDRQLLERCWNTVGVKSSE